MVNLGWFIEDLHMINRNGSILMVWYILHWIETIPLQNLNYVHSVDVRNFGVEAGHPEVIIDIRLKNANSLKR